MSWGESLLLLVVLVPAFLVIGFTFYDILRAAHLSLGRKIAWFVGVLLLPVFGTLLYLLQRPFPDPSSAAGDQVTGFVDLLDRREQGRVSDGEFAAATAQLFGSDR